VDSATGVVSVGVAIGVPYAVLASFVAAAANATKVRPSPLYALLCGLLLGTVGATWGAARGTGMLTRLTDELPAFVGKSLRAALSSVALLTVAGMLLTLGSLTVHARAAADLGDGLGGGLIAHAALLILDGLLLPNAAITAVGYLTGPGFAVGAGSSVSLSGAHVGAIPSLPLLAAVPHGPAPVTVRIAAVVVLLAAGALIGWRVTRDDRAGTWAAVGRSWLAAAIAGVAAALLVAVAGGPAGAGRMATVGASPWQVGLVLAAEVGFVASVTAAGLSRRS
jgi:hypothetical protein